MTPEEIRIHVIESGMAQLAERIATLTAERDRLMRDLVAITYNNLDFPR
jgi:hypothetical protein